MDFIAIYVLENICLYLNKSHLSAKKHKTSKTPFKISKGLQYDRIIGIWFEFVPRSNFTL